MFDTIRSMGYINIFHLNRKLLLTVSRNMTFPLIIIILGWTFQVYKWSFPRSLENIYSILIVLIAAKDMENWSKSSGNLFNLVHRHYKSLYCKSLINTFLLNPGQSVLLEFQNKLFLKKESFLLKNMELFILLLTFLVFS